MRNDNGEQRRRGANEFAATPEAICDCAQTKSENGTTLFSSAMMKKLSQRSRRIRMPPPPKRKMLSNMSAARPTRPTTMVSVGSSFTATPLKKNAAPQNRERDQHRPFER